MTIVMIPDLDFVVCVATVAKDAKDTDMKFHDLESGLSSTSDEA